jgi:hypothetical protein
VGKISQAYQKSVRAGWFEQLLEKAMLGVFCKMSQDLQGLQLTNTIDIKRMALDKALFFPFKLS